MTVAKKLKEVELSLSQEIDKMGDVVAAFAKNLEYLASEVWGVHFDLKDRADEIAASSRGGGADENVTFTLGQHAADVIKCLNQVGAGVRLDTLMTLVETVSVKMAERDELQKEFCMSADDEPAEEVTKFKFKARVGDVDGGFARVHFDTVSPVVDRPSTYSIGCPVKLVDRLVKAINDGMGIHDPEMVSDSNGKTYVSFGCSIVGRRLNADLKRLGY